MTTTTYCGYTIVQAFDGDSAKDVRRTFSDMLTAREAFAAAVATQKTGSVTLFGEHNDEPEDFARLNNMPEVLDYRGFDADSPTYDFERKEFVYA